MMTEIENKNDNNQSTRQSKPTKRLATEFQCSIEHTPTTADFSASIRKTKHRVMQKRRLFTGHSIAPKKKNLQMINTRKIAFKKLLSNRFSIYGIEMCLMRAFDFVFGCLAFVLEA